MMAPSTIGRYEIDRELGRGGMAVVYLAKDPAIERQVAVKVLPRQFTFDPQFRARFQREAKIIAALEHPAIVPVYDFGEDEEQLYLVMRYMMGGSLADRLEEGPLTVAEASRIYDWLAPGLDAAHARGIIHRDLKPANILFDEWDKPYLSDFGIVKLVEGSPSALTATGGLVGTPAYMSPEQVIAQVELDGRSDIYAMGVVLFEILSGKMPYEANTPMGLAFMHANEPVPRILDANSSLPACCMDLIDRAMAKYRHDRFPTAAALAQAIREITAPASAAATATASAAATATVFAAGTIREEEPLKQELAGTEVLDTSSPSGEILDKDQSSSAGVESPVSEIPQKTGRSRRPVWLWLALALVLFVGVIGVIGVGIILLTNGGEGDPSAEIRPLTQETEPALTTIPRSTDEPASSAGGLLEPAVGEEQRKVCAVLDTGGENDRSFNEFTLKGARDAAEVEGLDFAHIVSESETDYEKNINNFIDEGCGLIITVGFLMGDSTAVAARENPDVQFAIVDFDYFPGFGCDESLSDCYADDLSNVTSLMFSEDEVGYLAGILAGCMSESGIIGSVSGMEVPPVVKFVVGYQNGAKSQNPNIETLNVYIPDFNDPSTGKQAGQSMIDDGADIIFGVGGNTGNGGLLAAHEAGLLGIGVDVDQYFTYPDVASSLLTSAAKNMDVAAYDAVVAFANGQLEAGIKKGTVENGGIGLAPYHDQEDNISDVCLAAVETAAAGLAVGTIDTGYNP
jgi:basic membrane lipoprotein Med (substrate-binding protein (PBP1-ABC) superfamily)